MDRYRNRWDLTGKGNFRTWGDAMRPDDPTDNAGQSEPAEEPASDQPQQEASGNGLEAGSVPASGPWRGNGRRPRPHQRRRVQGARLPEGSRATRPQSRQLADGQPPRAPSPPAACPVARVILIERSSGVQVGRHNRQASAYLVTVPQASFGSAQRLAGALLSPHAPWARDLFSHDARPDLAGLAGGRPGTSSRSIMKHPGGDTLVIVRNSRGVQVGNRNVQRNRFRVMVRAVAVHAEGIGMTRKRLEWISRLRQHPGDRTAARLLAEDLGQAARARLHADLSAKIRQITGNTQIRRLIGKFLGLHGRQIGGPTNRARVRVHVAIGKFDTRALERALRTAGPSREPPTRQRLPVPRPELPPRRTPDYRDRPLRPSPVLRPGRGDRGR